MRAWDNLTKWNGYTRFTIYFPTLYSNHCTLPIPIQQTFSYAKIIWNFFDSCVFMQNINKTIFFHFANNNVLCMLVGEIWDKSLAAVTPYTSRLLDHRNKTRATLSKVKIPPPLSSWLINWRILLLPSNNMNISSQRWGSQTWRKYPYCILKV